VDLHGNLYYFGRNEALDANNFFANATGVPRENSAARNPVALWGANTLVKETRLFLCFLPGHKGCQWRVAGHQCSSLSLPHIPLVRTPATLGSVFGGQTGLFGGVAVAPMARILTR